MFKCTATALGAALLGAIAVSAPATAADTHNILKLDDLKFEQGGPGISFALVWGDWNKGDYGMVVRIKAGHAAPLHSHTHDYHGVTIQGNWVHSYGDGVEHVLTPGAYAFQAGGDDHGDRCAGTEDCLILIHQHGPRDFHVADEQAKSN